MFLKSAEVQTNPEKHPLLRERRRLIDEVCSEDSSYCYKVYDISPSYEEGHFVFRALVHSARNKGIESGVLLHAPRARHISFERDFSALQNDKFNFCVHHKGANSQADELAACMLPASFLLSSLSLYSSNVGKQVLSIGLGGGNIDMALSVTKPEVNITVVELDALVVAVATKWFGVTETSHHHIVIQDGVEFLKNAEMKGLKYDVVYVDACGSGAVVCPVKAFRTANVVRMMKNVLKETGTIIINLARNMTEEKKFITECTEECSPVVLIDAIVLDSRSCSHHTSDLQGSPAVTHHYQVNVILICSPSALPNSDRQVAELNDRLRSLERLLNIDHYSKQPEIVPVKPDCSFSDFRD